MKENDRVKTEFGNGTLMHKEGDRGWLSKRWCVRLDVIPIKRQWLHATHAKYGGIFMMENELEIIEGELSNE